MTRGERVPPGAARDGRVRDLAIGGCALVTDRALPIGEARTVEISLPGHTLQARLRVTRVDAPDAEGQILHACRFERISTADEDRLHRLVLDHQRQDLRGESVEPPLGPPPEVAL